LAAFEHAYEAGAIFLEGAPAQAIAKTRKAVEMWLQHCPSAADQTQGLAWRGRVHLLLQERARALSDLRAALAQDASHFQARLSLAGALFLLDPAESGDHLEILRKQQPHSEKILFPLARVRRGQGRFDEARRILDGLLAADRDHAAVLLERGNVALDAHEPQEAEPFLRRALALAPENPQCVLPLSRCLHLLHQHAEAKDLQERYRLLEAQQVRSTEAWLQKTRDAARPRSPSGEKK
jgi:tetratricopeptide (TPR) repeat protein